MKTIFTGLNERALSLSINIANSGFILENTTFPHISIQQITCTNYQDNSLVSRTEENVYQFSVYDDNFDNVEDYINIIKDNFSFAILDIDYRRFSTIHYLGHSFNEEVPGIYHGIIRFYIYTEKDYVPNNNVVNSLRFYDGIKTINDNNIQAVMVLGYQLENVQPPYVSVAGLFNINDDANSQANLNNKRFSFEAYDYDLNNLEQTMEKIHDNYDYCLIDIKQERTLTVQWLLDTIIELEPGIWRAKLDYTCMVEELINV